MDSNNIDRKNNTTISDGQAIDTWFNLVDEANEMVASGGSGSITYSASEGAVFLNEKGMKNEVPVDMKTVVIAHKLLSESITGAYLIDIRDMMSLSYAAYVFDGSSTSYNHLGSWVKGISINGDTLTQSELDGFNAKTRVFNDTFQITVIEANDFVSAPLHLLERFNEVAQGKGYIYEVIGLDRLMTDAEMESLTRALGTKWNVSEMSGVFNDDITFSEAADFGAKPLQFLGQTNVIDSGTLIEFDALQLGQASGAYVSTALVHGQLVGRQVTVTTKGQMDLKESSSITVSDTMVIDAGGALHIEGSADIQAIRGDVQLMGSGSLTAVAIEGNVTVDGSTNARLSVGRVTGNVMLIHGDMVPGNSPGISTIIGDYTQGTNGRLSIEINGTATDAFDQLVVSGTASLGGILAVTPLDGYSPAIGDAFTIIDAGSIAGSFDMLVMTPLEGNLRWDTSDLYSTGTIRVAASFDEYPQTPAPVQDNSVTGLTQSWSDGGFAIRVKSSDTIAYNTQFSNYGAYKLFNNAVSGDTEHFHSGKHFNSTGAYTGSTTFKAHQGLVLSVDFGQAIAIRDMKLWPRDSAYGISYADVAMPKSVAVYGSNNPDAWDDAQHKDWTLMHEANNLTHVEGAWNTLGQLSGDVGAYQYIAMVVTHITGNYGYLTMSEWQIEGEPMAATVPFEPTISTAGDGVAESSVTQMPDGSTLLIFKYDAASDNGQGQTEYTVDFPANVVADVLIVGGGGGSGNNGNYYGGGGAGGLIFEHQLNLSGELQIKVGDGGEPNRYSTSSSVDNRRMLRENSEVLYSNGINRIAEGGGHGGLGTHHSNGHGGIGGSGGGGTAMDGNWNGGVGNQNNSPEAIGFGHNGGSGYGGSGQDNNYGGGGGGAGGPGGNGVARSHGGHGGIGKDMSMYFGTTVGDSGWFAGGGGGGLHGSHTNQAGKHLGNASQGGGGGWKVEDGDNEVSRSGMPHTGGGGSGLEASGGSGIVIIRYVVDTDGDGFSDEREDASGTDKNDATSRPNMVTDPYGLMAHLTFDDATNLNADTVSNASIGSFYGTKGTNFDGTSDGVIGGGFQLLDTADGLLHIDADDANNPRLNDVYKGDFSISFWGKLMSPHASGQSYSRMVSLFEHDDTHEMVLIGGHYSYGNNISIDINPRLIDGSSSWIKNTSLLMNTFYHVAIVVSVSDQTLTIYADGEPLSNINAINIVPDHLNQRISIGNVIARNRGSDAIVDDFRVYNRALTPSEINALAYPDTDGDGVTDAKEIDMGSDPTDPTSMFVPDFSDVVDAEIGMASGLDSMESHLALWLDASNINLKTIPVFQWRCG